MSNYCDQPFYQQNIYTNTYSLWENSAYYDINNLSPQNFTSGWHRANDEDFETRYTSGPTEVEVQEPPDHRNRRIIDRASLYEDPDTFYQELNEDTSPPTSQWTQFCPQNAGEEEEGPSSKNKGKMVRTNRIQKRLDKILAKPVKMSKAESMMQKMGWHGGALGRTGTGIVQPIAPNAVYATKKVGLGQALQSIPKPKKVENKEYFTMNVLYHIYEFVKNNAEIELLFDKKLYKEERKRIHNIVQFMLNVDGLAMVDFESNAQMDVVLQICDINCYILHTQSEGEHPDRRICIYKEAPAHVYLIIPDDLRDEPSTKDPTIEQADSQEDASDNEAEEETNPFLRSITRNLKKTKEAEKEKTHEAVKQKIPQENQSKESRIAQKILEFFTEFAEQKKYSQFKFLGPFNEEEWEGIRDFLDKAALYLNNETCDAKEVFDRISFEIGEDITGNTVINKRPK